MLGAVAHLTSSPLSSLGQGLAQTTIPADAPISLPVAPFVILILCALAGVGTVLLLPGRAEPSIRKIGGVVLLVAGLIFAAILVRWTAGSAAGGMGAYFWIFSAIALVGAVRVVTHTRPVYSALYFVLTVFATAGLFVLLWAEFMAAALVIIYAGAILITYLFVIMLAAEAASPPGAKQAIGGIAEHDAVSREPIVASAVGFALMAIFLFVIFDKAAGIERATATPPAHAMAAGSTESLAWYLFENQLVNLELAGLILTIGMVGAIVIARKHVVRSVEDFDPARAIAPVQTDVVLGPATPVDDNPHSIPVVGTLNPRQKAYPET